ncbi:hypothetical protein M0R45_036428 [Rubus argutus]|uniref:Uncharacterized protein n=1 Tax=Rubus argutus TaxID=59490 RepID=A0AAW1VYU8_RUBAR
MSLALLFPVNVQFPAVRSMPLPQNLQLGRTYLGKNGSGRLPWSGPETTCRARHRGRPVCWDPCLCRPQRRGDGILGLDSFNDYYDPSLKM